MKTNSHCYGMILAGGSGTRLWPLSTQAQPKQFLRLGGNDSLYEQTAKRLQAFLSPEHIGVIASQKYQRAFADTSIKLNENLKIWEPEAKNTAPALALAAFVLQQRDPEAVMGVFPADHHIHPKQWPAFSHEIELAYEIAVREKCIVTLGIQPSSAHTGYGYIEAGEKSLLHGAPYYQVKAFHEKPNLLVAKKYLEASNYYWNSGMFIWPVEVFWQEISRYQPKMAKLFRDLAAKYQQKDFTAAVTKVFNELDNISIDYALLEYSKRVQVIPVSFEWDDIGALNSFDKILPRDLNENHAQGKILSLNAKHNIVVSTEKPIALIGVDDLIVIEGEKGIIVAKKDQAQDVKQIVEQLRRQGDKDYL